MQAHFHSYVARVTMLCLLTCYSMPKAAQSTNDDSTQGNIKHTLQCTSQHPAAQGQSLKLTTIGSSDILIDDQPPPADEIVRQETAANYLLTYRLKGKPSVTAILSKKMTTARLSRTTEDANNVFWFCNQ
jgi:hypothetical protein